MRFTCLSFLSLASVPIFAQQQQTPHVSSPVLDDRYSVAKMKAKQAKDFLMQQAGEQAARENVPLSDIEKRMMYFTESDATSCDFRTKNQWQNDTNI